MLFRSEPVSVRRPQLAILDRHAIKVAGHLLITGIWLERQVVATPKLLSMLVEGNTPRPSDQSVAHAEDAL